MTLRRSLRPLVALAISLSLVIGFGTSVQASVLVKASGSFGTGRFRPKILSVNRGTKVVWKATSNAHTVTAYSGQWHKDTTISQGTKTHFTFDTRGTYKYRCTFHSHFSHGQCSGMCGKIVVG
jgi:plastocyanin